MGLAQHVISPVRTVKITGPTQVPDTVVLDTLMIVPGALVVDPPLDTEYYAVDYGRALWMWRKRPPMDSVVVRYVPLPLGWRPVRLYSDSLMLSEFPSPRRQEAWRKRAVSKTPVISEPLDVEGYIERGLAGGNRLPAVLRSDMALRVVGSPAPGWNLEAALSDRSVPAGMGEVAIVPAAADAIYAHLKGPIVQLRLGSLHIVSDSGAYFLRYRSPGRGVMLAHVWSSAPGQVFYGFMPGTFQRMRFIAREGFSGPYLLKGRQGESPVAVIPGSEKVYYNGRLLRRGENADYTIDYLSGLLTFTPAIFPRGSDRVVVEFRYAGRAYRRSSYGGHQHIPVSERVSFHVRWYGEEDLRGRPVLFQPAPEALQKMTRSRGEPVLLDDGIDSTSDSTAGVRYARKDSMGYSIFYIPADPDSARYRVVFSYLGPGRGDYVRQLEPLAGVVYRWVAPVDGRSQGEYAPGIYLPPPQAHRMAEATMRWQPLPYVDVELGGAFSYVDSNTYAARWGKTPGAALRGRLGLENAPHTLGMRLAYEWRQASFRPVERYRPVEFERQWIRYEGLSGTEPWWRAATAEHVGQLTAYWKPAAPFHVGGQVHAIRRIGWFQGVAGTVRQQWKHDSSFWNLTEAWAISRVQDSLRIMLGQYRVEGQQQWRRFVFHFKGDFRRNRFFRYDSLVVPSEQVWQLSPRLVRRGRRHRLWIASEVYLHRRLGDSLRPTTYLWTSSGGGHWQRGRFFLDGQAGVQWDLLKGQARLSGRLEARGNLGPALRWNLFYQQQPSFQRYETFRFVRVMPGQGTHIWLDQNGDGIPQIEEMVPARYADQAEYVRVRVPTDSFLRRVGHRWRVHLFWRPASSRRAFLWGSEMRVEGDALGTSLLPQGWVGDSAAGRATLRGYGRAHVMWPGRGLRLQWSSRLQKAVQPFPYGVDRQESGHHQVTLRWVPVRHAGWEATWAAEQIRRRHDRSYALLPRLESKKSGGYWRLFRAFSPRWQGQATLMVHHGYLKDSATYPFTQLGMQLYSAYAGRHLTKVAFRAGLFYVRAARAIPQQTAYVGLEGRVPGFNPEASLSVRWPLGRQLQGTLQLEARQPQGTPWVITGNVGLRYLFQ